MTSSINKQVIITGGGSGIGLATAKTFAEAGAHVHILEICKVQGENIAAELRAAGFKVDSYVCDVADQAMVMDVITGIANRHAIDILINNAGISHIGTVETTSELDMDRLYTINIKGTYNCMHAVIPHMKATGGGVILNMASIASSIGLADRFAYSMTKGAVLSMTMSVAKDYVNHNIRCNCISPARVHTPFVDGFIAKNYAGQETEMLEKLSKTQPIGRMAQPEEVAALAFFLCSDQASFITGSDYPIDGGFIKLNN